MCDKCEINSQHVKDLEAIYKNAKKKLTLDAQESFTFETQLAFTQKPSGITTFTDHDALVTERIKAIKYLAHLLQNLIYNAAHCTTPKQETTEKILAQLQQNLAEIKSTKAKRAKKNVIRFSNPPLEVDPGPTDNSPNELEQSFRELEAQVNLLNEANALPYTEAMLQNNWIRADSATITAKREIANKVFKEVKEKFYRLRSEKDVSQSLTSVLSEAKSIMTTTAKEIAELQEKITNLKEKIFPTTDNTELLKDAWEKSKLELKTQVEQFLSIFIAIDFAATKDQHVELSGEAGKQQIIDKNLQYYIAHLRDIIDKLFKLHNKTIFNPLHDKNHKQLLEHMQLEIGNVTIFTIKLLGNKEKPLEQSDLSSIAFSFSNKPLSSKDTKYAAKYKERIALNYQIASLLATSKVKTASRYNALQIKIKANNSNLPKLRQHCLDQIDDIVSLAQEVKLLPDKCFDKAGLVQKIPASSEVLIQQHHLENYNDNNLQNAITRIKASSDDCLDKSKRIVKDQKVKIQALKNIQKELSDTHKTLKEAINTAYAQQQTNLNKELEKYASQIFAAQNFCTHHLSTIEKSDLDALLTNLTNADSAIKKINEDNAVVNPKPNLQKLFNDLDSTIQSLTEQFTAIKKQAEVLSKINEHTTTVIPDSDLSKENPYYLILPTYQAQTKQNIIGCKDHQRLLDTTKIEELDSWYTIACTKHDNLHQSSSEFNNAYNNANIIEKRLKSECYTLSQKILQDIKEEFNRIINELFPEQEGTQAYMIDEEAQGSIHLKNIDVRLEKLQAIYRIFKQVNEEYINKDVSLLSEKNYAPRLINQIERQLINPYMKDLSQGILSPFVEWVNIHILQPLKALVHWCIGKPYPGTVFSTNTKQTFVTFGRNIISQINETEQEQNLQVKAE